MIYRIIIFVVLLCSTVLADVDLIVQAREYWRDGKVTTGWTKKDFKDFWSQTHKGEIISAFETGTWDGKEIHPPTFVVITVKGVTVAQAKQYLEPLLDSNVTAQDDSMQVKQRRFYFRRAVIDSALSLWAANGSNITLTKQQAITFIKKYNVAGIKQKIKNRLKR